MNTQPNDMRTVVSDWIPAAVLAGLVGSDVKTVYNQHSSGRGPLAPILTKIGGRLGCWREDYDAWKAQQRRLADAEQPDADRAHCAATRVATDNHAAPHNAGAAPKSPQRMTAAKPRRAGRK